MDWLLIAATGISLALATAMSVVAWRLLRHDRERSAARIEALEALAFADGSSEAPPVRRADAQGSAERLPMPASPSIPASTSLRMAAPLAGEDHDRTAVWDTLLHGTPRQTLDIAEPAIRLAPADVASRPLFDESPSHPVLARRSLAVATAFVVMALGAGAVTWLRSPSVLASVANVMRDGHRVAVNDRPLELLSLRHTINPAGMFSVMGLVQNAADGRDIEQIEAVVYLFDDTGQFFATGRAPIDIPTLGPGDESAFVVRMPTTTGVSRYRVGFKRADGKAVAHVDHRGHLPEGTTGDVLTDPDVVTPATITRPVGGARAAGL